MSLQIAAVAAFVVLPQLAAQNDVAPADREFADPAVPYCEYRPATLDFDTVHQNDEAKVGGVWWLSRRGNEADVDAMLQTPEALTLRAGDGTTITPELRVTFGAVGIVVPESGTANSTFLMQGSASTEGGVVLRVGSDEARVAAFDLESVTAGAPSPASCSAECDDGASSVIPRAPTVDIVYEGDPVIVDAWVLTEGIAVNAESERLVDTRLITADGVDHLTTLVVDSDYDGDVAMEINVELRDPDSLEVLHTERVMIGELEPVEIDTTDLQSCDDYYGDDYYYDDDYYGDCTCVGVSGTGLGFWLLSGLFVAGRMRRRRHA